MENILECQWFPGLPLDPTEADFRKILCLVTAWLSLCIAKFDSPTLVYEKIFPTQAFLKTGNRKIMIHSASVVGF